MGRGPTPFLLAGGVSDIWRQPLAGGPPKQLTHNPGGLIFQLFWWTSDNKSLLVTRGSRSADIVLLRANKTPK